MSKGILDRDYIEDLKLSKRPTEGETLEFDNFIRSLFEAIDVLSAGMQEIFESGDTYYVRNINPQNVARVPRSVSADILKQVWGTDETTPT